MRSMLDHGLRRHLLVDWDSAIPNLALMQVGAWLRSRGDEVALVRPRLKEEAPWNPDEVWISCVFTWNGASARGLAQMWSLRGATVHLGGTGADFAVEDGLLVLRSSSHLPEGAESVPPDYSLYPDDDRALGFSVRGCNRKCEFCLTPENLVLTGDGPKSISTIIPGELVLTHKGRYRKVVNTIHRQYDGPILRLQSGALADLFPTRVTPEHPIWSRRVSYRSGGQRLTEFRWLLPSQIRPWHPHRSKDSVPFPRTKTEETPEGYRPFVLSEDLMRIVGWYLAEGHVQHSSKRGYHRTTFSLGHSDLEMQYAREIQWAGLGIGIKVKVRRLKTGIRATVDEVEFARWLVKEFGTGASVKRLPLWVRLLPPTYLRPLVEAWAKGDGHFLLKKGTPTWKITTVSPDLVIGLREVVLKLGLSCTINKHQTSDVIQGRKVNVKPAYTAIFHARNNGTKRSIVADQDYYYYKGRPPIAEPVRYSGLVFNLEVEDDNSYCTPGFALHNCVVPQKEGKIDAGSYRPLRSWVPDDRRKVLLLDNNIAQSPFHDQVFVEAKEAGLKLSVTQGYDARHVTEERAAFLADHMPWALKFGQRMLYTAWDYMGVEGSVRRAIERLLAAGIRGRDIMCYMLCGFNTTFEEDFYRFETLRDLGVYPYVMTYNRRRDDRRLNAFARYINRTIWKACSWEDYNRRPGYYDLRAEPPLEDFPEAVG